MAIGGITIEDGIYLIKAPGHTMGNSIVIVGKMDLDNPPKVIPPKAMFDKA